MKNFKNKLSRNEMRLVFAGAIGDPDPIAPEGCKKCKDNSSCSGGQVCAKWTGSGPCGEGRYCL